MNCFNENELISWVNNLVAFCKVLFVEDFALGRFRRREIRVDPEDQLEFHRDKAKRELVDRRVAPILNLRWIRRIDVRVEVSDRRTTIFDEKKKRKTSKMFEMKIKQVRFYFMSCGIEWCWWERAMGDWVSDDVAGALDGVSFSLLIWRWSVRLRKCGWTPISSLRWNPNRFPWKTKLFFLTRTNKGDQ